MLHCMGADCHTAGMDPTSLDPPAAASAASASASASASDVPARHVTGAAALVARFYAHDPVHAGKHELADAVREVVRYAHLLDAATAGSETVAALTAAARELAEALAAAPSLTAHGSPAAAPTSAASVVERSPLCGRGNPIAPPLELTFHDDRVEGVAVFTEAYEGPPGAVHGGVVAAAFDSMLGAAQVPAGAMGPTGTLTIRLLAPTPLHVPVVFTGRVERREGRKLHVTADATAAGTRCAEASAVFILRRDT